MAHNDHYEYMDETSIDPALMCVICDRPFEDPIDTPCEHSFCRQCMTQWLQSQTSCPTCRQLLSQNDLTQPSRIVRDMLGRLRIKCVACGQQGLQRGNFNDHLSKACLRANRPCPSADMKCPWTGPRDQVNTHLAECLFNHLRPALASLLGENQQLKEQVKQHQSQLDKHRDEIHQLREQMKQQQVRLDEFQAERLSQQFGKQSSTPSWKPTHGPDDLFQALSALSDHKQFYDIGSSRHANATLNQASPLSCGRGYPPPCSSARCGKCVTCAEHHLRSVVAHSNLMRNLHDLKPFPAKK